MRTYLCILSVTSYQLSAISYQCLSIPYWKGQRAHSQNKDHYQSNQSKITGTKSESKITGTKIALKQNKFCALWRRGEPVCSPFK
ncbi:MAG: hypothetical protein DRR00_18275 [Candidatus Parabeggiatoa sp. nov. 3]|nr:MAG: hypothetical protein DRR00_18275 [Gammaproteobacteria bacterium]